MDKLWKVERNDGSHAHLTFGTLIRHIERPPIMSRTEFFILLAPRSSVKEDTLRARLKPGVN